MEARIIKLRFSAPLHLGYRESTQESSLDYIPSDLLFSAFCNMYRLLYGKKELEKMLKRQQTSPDILFTSAFPFYEDCYFLPRPLNLNLDAFGWEYKKAKRVRYIDYDTFIRFTQSKLNAKYLMDYLPEPVQGMLMPVEYENARVKMAYEVPRAALDSITNASNIYYFQQVSFNNGAGLYLLVAASDEHWDKIKACFRLLGDEGIGGDRSSGKGSFQAEFPGKMIFPVPEKPAGHVLLSLYYPTALELEDFDGDYNLITRAGYVFSLDEINRRRQTVRMMSEGTVVYSSSAPRGKMVDVTPPGFEKHNVFRNGVAFSVALCSGRGETSY